MFKKVVFACFFIVNLVQSQNVVTGKLTADNEYKVVVLYQLKGINQNYIKNVDIVDGKFSLEIPENTAKGMYRIAYDLKNNFYVDFIYNNESIDLEFDPLNPDFPANFIKSDENRIQSNYTFKTNTLRQKLDSIQLTYLKTRDELLKDSLANSYLDFHRLYTQNQESFETESNGKLVKHFLKSEFKYYAPEIIATPQEYLNSEVEHFFKYIDFTDAELRNSTIITQKVIDYIFYLNRSDDPQVQKALYKNAVIEVMKELGDDNSLISEISTGLMYAFIQVGDYDIIDLILNSIYKKLPNEFIDSAVVQEIESKIKLAIGRTAPDFLWTEKGKTMKLSDLKSNDTYVLVFWSTTCSHCLVEIPELYNYLKDDKEVKMIAVALEKDTIEFDKITPKYQKSIQILGLGKWENAIAKQYNIISTPTYFVLDANKTIIAKPEFFKDLKAFLVEASKAN